MIKIDEELHINIYSIRHALRKKQTQQNAQKRKPNHTHTQIHIHINTQTYSKTQKHENL